MNKLEAANEELKRAVATRLESVAAGKPFEKWYEGEAATKSNGEQRKLRPGSLAFMEVLEELRSMHLKKSQDYGDPADPLANIRVGADVVGIEPWRGCVIRIADKMQRIRSYCRDGVLANESFEDALLDCASYAIISLIMFRETKSP